MTTFERYDPTLSKPTKSPKPKDFITVRANGRMTISKQVVSTLKISNYTHCVLWYSKPDNTIAVKFLNSKKDDVIKAIPLCKYTSTYGPIHQIPGNKFFKHFGIKTDSARVVPVLRDDTLFINLSTGEKIVRKPRAKKNTFVLDSSFKRAL